MSQDTAEIYTFGSGFWVLRVASELIIYFFYKLWIFRSLILGHADIFYDNEYVYKNTAFSESTHKKKHNSICYIVIENMLLLVLCLFITYIPSTTWRTYL